THAPGDFNEEWDRDSLIADAGTYWPTSLSAADLLQATSSDGLYDLLMSDATRHYGEREAEVGESQMRHIERQVMLKVIDARWRDHLKEMDRLQEGINLRALGQKDPLSEWQREGYDMFGQLMSTIAREYVQYVMHVQIVTEDKPAIQPRVANLSYTAPESPSSATPAGPAAVAGGATASPASAPAPAAEEPSTQQPVVKTEWEKTPRNAPCPCGSGKKYKACHGAA
ncbi:MAG: SEC-C metal-binding domain-containing protein, partial [Microthrixaceae bacterium]